MLFKNYPEGFVINGERRFEKGEGWNMARYIGRYVKHPPIAEKRGIDKEQVLCDFQHLKMQGEVYEPKSGEIRMCFEHYQTLNCPEGLS